MRYGLYKNQQNFRQKIPKNFTKEKGPHTIVRKSGHCYGCKRNTKAAAQLVAEIVCESQWLAHACPMPTRVSCWKSEQQLLLGSTERANVNVTSESFRTLQHFTPMRCIALRRSSQT